MTDINSTSTQAKSALSNNAYISPLNCIISNAYLLHQTGYDEKDRKVTYIGETEDLAYLGNCADTSITTIARGISVIGKLLVNDDHALSYVDDTDIGALGWLLSELGASIVALQNIQVEASNAVHYARMSERNNNV